MSSLSTLLADNKERTRAVFEDEVSNVVEDDERRYDTSTRVEAHSSHQARISSKMWLEYRNVKELPFFLAEKQPKSKQAQSKAPQANGLKETKLIMDAQRSQRYSSDFRAKLKRSSGSEPSNALTIRMPTTRPPGAGPAPSSNQPSTSLIRRENYQPIKPDWHAPWKLRRVIRYVAFPFPLFSELLLTFQVAISGGSDVLLLNLETNGSAQELATVLLKYGTLPLAR